MAQALVDRALRTILSVATLAGAASLLAPAAAVADDFHDRVNAPFKMIQPDKRSDTVLLPLAARLAPPPAGATPAYQAALLPHGTAPWAEAEAWAQAAPQAAFIAALPTVTGEDDWKKAFAFGQPYGAAGVDPEIIGLRAYTDLGDPPLLGMARHLYLPMLDRAECLVHVEATRLSSAGKPTEAIDLLWRWLHFSRSMCDRAFEAEVAWGLKSMTLAAERLRDVAYVDSRRDKPLLTPEHLAREVILKRLKDRNGYLDISRLEFPQADGTACAQLIKRVFVPGGEADKAVFSPILAKASGQGRPLRMFSEIARWDSIANLHAKELETNQLLRNVMGDWRARWGQDYFAPTLKFQTDFEKLDKVRLAIIAVIVGDLSPLFKLRHRVRVELAGTRSALAAQAFVLGQKVNPPGLTSARPAYIDRFDPDPYDNKHGILQYFVPVRDAIRSELSPVTFHEVHVFPGPGYQPFKKKLDESTFVVYSIGPDGALQSCTRATQTVEDSKGDYLIWPPLMSLLREHLQETGALK